MNLRAVLRFTACAFMIWFVAVYPVTVAHGIREAGSFLATSAGGLAAWYAAVMS